MLDALSPQRRRLVLGVAGLILLLVTALVITIAVRALTPTPDPVPQGQPGPVLLVPGYGGRIESLDPLAAALAMTGALTAFAPRAPKGLAMFWPVFDELERGLLALPNKESMK